MRVSIKAIIISRGVISELQPQKQLQGPGGLKKRKMCMSGCGVFIATVHVPNKRCKSSRLRLFYLRLV